MHLTPEHPVDLYAGPMLVYSIFDGASADWQGSWCWPWASSGCKGSGSIGVGTSNDLGFGLQAGVDIPFGSRSWGFHTSVKYLNSSHSFSHGGGNGALKLDINPVVFTAGLSFKF